MPYLPSGSHKSSELAYDITTAGADIELQKQINGETRLPRQIYFGSNGTFVFNFGAYDLSGGPANPTATQYAAQSITVQAGTTLPISPLSVDATTTSGYKLVAIY